MNKKSIGFFCIAISCLIAGTACHGLRISDNPVKFKIGVAAISFAIAGIIVAVKDKSIRQYVVSPDFYKNMDLA